MTEEEAPQPDDYALELEIATFSNEKNDKNKDTTVDVEIDEQVEPIAGLGKLQSQISGKSLMSGLGGSTLTSMNSNSNDGDATGASKDQKHDCNSKENSLPIKSYLLKTKLASETENIIEITNDLIEKFNEDKKAKDSTTDKGKAKDNDNVKDEVTHK